MNMTPAETIEALKEAKKAVVSASLLECTCAESSLDVLGECTCLRGQELNEAESELWRIIALI